MEVSAASVDELKSAKAFALGCPAMGAEVLEELEMEPFVEDVEGFAQGKTIALFGSYGWGDGQWMRDWEDRMQEKAKCWNKFCLGLCDDQELQAVHVTKEGDEEQL